MVCAPSLRPLTLYGRLLLVFLRISATTVVSLRGEGQAVASLSFALVYSELLLGVQGACLSNISV